MTRTHGEKSTGRSGALPSSSPHRHRRASLPVLCSVLRSLLAQAAANPFFFLLLLVATAKLPLLDSASAKLGSETFFFFSFFAEVRRLQVLSAIYRSNMWHAFDRRGLLDSGCALREKQAGLKILG